jgi:beta-galactosidase
MLLRFALSILLALFASPTSAVIVPPGRQLRPLMAGWEFVREDIGSPDKAASFGWGAVALPHTWNKDDMQAGPNFHAGTGWYRRSLPVDSSLAGKRLFLRFEGVGSVADVFVNGRLVGSHKGSYSAFCLEITGAAKSGASNMVYVKVNNAPRPDVLPINNELFGIYGGIYRPVDLLITDQTVISPTDFASPGIYIRQASVSEASAELVVTARLQSGARGVRPLTMRTRVVDSAGRTVVTAERSVTVPPGTLISAQQELHIDRPILWDAKRRPYLYQLTTELVENGAVIDNVTQALGLRFYRIDPDSGFILNGRPYRLLGVTRHQEWLGYGNALSNAQHKTDLALIDSIGATAVRLAHYQQADYVYSYADTLGLVIWAEIPLVQSTSGAETENARQQLTELIRQNYNHPSIVMWGLHNEVYGKDEFAYTSQLTEGLHNLAKTEDADRPDVSTSGSGAWEQGAAFHADLQGINRYFGWYYGKITDLGPWFDSTRIMRPGVRFALAEYGAEANIQQQSESLSTKFDAVKGQFFPENYQTYFHEQQWPVILAHPNIWGSFVWNMFDFSVPLWSRGGVPARNMKGLVSYDRKVKKDAFYYYQANWSKLPVLHINEKRLRARTVRSADLTVYSNLEHTELWLNGKRLGPATIGGTPVHLIWKGVAFRRGKNAVRAVAWRDGRQYTDEATWEVTY